MENVLNFSDHPKGWSQFPPTSHPQSFLFFFFFLMSSGVFMSLQGTNTTPPVLAQSRSDSFSPSHTPHTHTQRLLNPSENGFHKICTGLGRSEAG